MPAYPLSPEGIEKLTKTWTITILGAYAAIVAIFAYSLLYRGGDVNSICIFAAIVLAQIAFFIYGKKKYLAVTTSTRLIIDQQKVTLQVANQPDLAVHLSEVQELKYGKQGITLVNKNKKKRSLEVTNKFERFKEIEHLLTENIGKQTMQTVS